MRASGELEQECGPEEGPRAQVGGGSGRAGEITRCDLLRFAGEDQTGHSLPNYGARCGYQTGEESGGPLALQKHHENSQEIGRLLHWAPVFYLTPKLGTAMKHADHGKEVQRWVS